MDRDKATRLRKLLQVHLDAFGRENGLILTIPGPAHYTATSIQWKVEAAEVSDDGTVANKAVNAYRNQYRVYGLPEDGLGRIFVHGGKDFAIVGLNPRCRRYPVSALRLSDNKLYKFAPTSVLEYLTTRRADTAAPLARALGLKDETPRGIVLDAAKEKGYLQ